MAIATRLESKTSESKTILLNPTNTRAAPAKNSTATYNAITVDSPGRYKKALNCRLAANDTTRNTTPRAKKISPRSEIIREIPAAVIMIPRMSGTRITDEAYELVILGFEDC